MFGFGIPTISVEDLKAKLDRGDKFVLVDVREAQEIAICSIPGSLKIPLGNLAQRLAELSPGDEIVVHCKAGGRSGRAVKFLIGAGFGNSWNLAGGIDQWAEKIDPKMARY